MPDAILFWIFYISFSILFCFILHFPPFWESLFPFLVDFFLENVFFSTQIPDLID